MTVTTTNPLSTNVIKFRIISFLNVLNTLLWSTLTFKRIFNSVSRISFFIFLVYPFFVSITVAVAKIIAIFVFLVSIFVLIQWLFIPYPIKHFYLNYLLCLNYHSHISYFSLLWDYFCWISKCTPFTNKHLPK